MSPRAVRSFAVTLAIAITIFGPGASGFVIDRNKDTPHKRSTQAIDLLSNGTIDLTVKDEVRTSNDTKSRQNEDSGNMSSAPAGSSTSYGTTTKKTQETPKMETKTTSAPTRATTIQSTTEFLKIPTISSDTVEVFDSVEDTSSSKKGNNVTKEPAENDQTLTLETTQKFDTTKSVEDASSSKKSNNAIKESAQNDEKPTLGTTQKLETTNSVKITSTSKKSEINNDTTKTPSIKENTTFGTTKNLEQSQLTLGTTQKQGSINSEEVITTREKSEINNDTTKSPLKNQISTIDTTKKPEQSQLTTSSETLYKTDQPLDTSIDDDKTETIVSLGLTIDSSKLTTSMLQTNDEPTTTHKLPEIMSFNSTEETHITSPDSTMVTTELPKTTPNTFVLTKVEKEDVKSLDTTLPDSTEIATTERATNKFTDPFLGKYTKYTTIIRKRVVSSGETTTNAEEDIMRAETSNTVVNFEKAFNATPVPSIEKLKIEMLYDSTQPSINTEDPHSTERQATQLLLSSVEVVASTVAKRPGTFQTKRAGYIDNSEKTTTQMAQLTPLKSSVEITTRSGLKNETESPSTVEDNVATETEGPRPMKVNGFESQSQLAEDALQEEFLKEEALQNFEENSKRFREEFSQEVKPINSDTVLTTATPNNFSTDDLSVQPIEKYKTTLYTVSPNYKPMKKLEVQPAKPFVRDPDDNSWRNESISSLGIVFKPKNSSKSFKEVLKNKTQIELNNLIEKAKDEVPDLRVRLEKIAEVRKTKKKKMNKNGEVVYTDYEESRESSGETSSSAPKSDLLPSLLSSDEVYKLFTTSSSHISPEATTLAPTPPPLPPITTARSVEATTEEMIKRNRTAIKSIFSSLGLDGLTTTKPEKFFNAAEYYDTTDEYDADYVTMTKLDLQRFTMPPPVAKRPLPHAPPAASRPLEPHFPERRPTLQYFPPREPQKVNMNHIDEEFERKMSMFKYKEPQPAFVTVPPLPIATDQPAADTRPPAPARGPAPHDTGPDGRPIVRPSDYRTITPQDLHKNYYMTSVPASTEPQDGYLGPHLDRGSYVIKHYKDFLHDVAKGNEEQRRDDFLPFHTPGHEPAPTERELPALSTVADRTTYKSVDDEEDYDSRFHKEVLTRFVDNFNQNSERFKVDFPILYNNSIVHRQGEGAPAASRAFLKRYYPGYAGGGAGVATQTSGARRRGCEPHCDLTVELSPAYELHYYVPGQEEKQESATRTLAAHAHAHAPYRYGL